MKFVSGFVGNRLGGTLDWEYCKELKAHWDGPVVLKGILHPKDAEKAIEIGLDGIYVSNHGARQFNGALPAIKALPEIVFTVWIRVVDRAKIDSLIAQEEVIDKQDAANGRVHCAVVREKGIAQVVQFLGPENERGEWYEGNHDHLPPGSLF